VLYCCRKCPWLGPALLLCFIPGPAQTAVTVSEDTVTLKTWSEGLPDTNPWFELFPSYNYPMYPYTLRNNFGSTTSAVAWRDRERLGHFRDPIAVNPSLGKHTSAGTRCIILAAALQPFFE
jgi:hypothetical protein